MRRVIAESSVNTLGREPVRSAASFILTGRRVTDTGLTGTRVIRFHARKTLVAARRVTDRVVATFAQPHEPREDGVGGGDDEGQDENGKGETHVV